MKQTRITECYRSVKKRKIDESKSSQQIVNERVIEDRQIESEQIENHEEIRTVNENRKLENAENLIRSTNRNRSNDVEFMRTIFKDAQHVHTSQVCLTNLHRFIEKFEFDEFYKEFCYNLKCSLQFAHDNPNSKNILNTIATFLLVLKQKHSESNLKRKSTFDTNSDQMTKKRKAKVNDENASIDEISFLVSNGLFADGSIVNRSFSKSYQSNEVSSELNNATHETTRSTRSKSKRLKDSTNTLNRSNLTNANDKIDKNDKTRSKISRKSNRQITHKMYCNLLDSVISDILIPFLQSTKVNTRLNSCYLLRKLVNSIDDFEINLFKRLELSILERLIDVNSRVRSSAAFLLYRFQSELNRSNHEKNESQKVEDALSFHLKYDQSPAVRLSCLNVILINKNTLSSVLSKTRDVNNLIREQAFCKLAKAIDFKNDLLQDDKLFLIKNGLNDRKSNVVKAFKYQMVPAWIRSHDYDLVEFVHSLDLCENHELIERFLNCYLDSMYNQTKLTKFHHMLIDFCRVYLDDNFLIRNHNQFECEIHFLWSLLTKYLNAKETELDKAFINFEQIDLRSKMRDEFRMALGSLKKDNESNFISNQSDSQDSSPNISQIENTEVDKNNNQTINIPIQQVNDKNDQHCSLPIINLAERSNKEVDLSILDLILPAFSKFVEYFQSFCEQLDDKDYENEEDLVIDEFKFRQLIVFFANYKVEDDSQRSTVLNLIEVMISLDQNASNFSTYIELLVTYVKENVIKDKKEFYEYLIDLQRKVEEHIEKEELERTQIKVTLEDIRKLELLNADKTIKMHLLKDSLDEALSNVQYDRAHVLQTEIESIKCECNKLVKQIQKMKNIHENYQESNNEQMNVSDDDRIDALLKNHPLQHIKLLQLLQITIDHSKMSKMNSVIETKFNQYIIPGILNENSMVRYSSIKALNELCFYNSEIANRFFPLYVNICTNDNENVQNLALKGLIDSLIEHGLVILSSDDNDVDSSNNDETNERDTIPSDESTDQQIDQQADLQTEEHYDASTDSPADLKSEHHQITNDKLVDKSCFIDQTVLNKEEDQNLDLIRINKQITKEFIKFIIKFIKSNTLAIRSTSVMGICKLLLLRIYSPKLLSELILLWYNSSTCQSIRHDIGTFLPIYCLAESTLDINLPSHLNGQNCLLECFMYTVENFYDLERGTQVNSSYDVAYSNYYDSDIDVLNVIEFMLNLLEPTNHVKIVLEFCEKILDLLKLERDDEYELREPFITKYLIRSLKSFNLFEASEDQLERLRLLVDEIQSQPRYSQLKKSLVTRFDKFKEKLIV